MTEPVQEIFADAPVGATRLIAPGTFAVNAPFWGFPNVVYFLESGGRWALIDTGVAETPPLAIAPFLEAQGGLDRLELVLGTHGHVDHIGGNSWVKEHAPQARFGLGALDVGWAEDVDRHYCQLYAFGCPGPWKPDADSEKMIREACGEPVAIDHPLVGGEVLTFGAGREIETVHLGAHSPGQMLYLDRQSGSAFSGDAVQRAGIFNTEWGTRDFPMYRTVPDYVRSLETIRAAQLDRLCTAHAGVYEMDATDAFIDSALAWTAAYTETLRGAARELGDFSLEEMVDRVHALRPEYAVILQIRVTTSEHLDVLVREGSLFPHMRSGQKRWSTARQI